MEGRVASLGNIVWKWMRRAGELVFRGDAAEKPTVLGGFLAGLLIF